MGFFFGVCVCVFFFFFFFFFYNSIEFSNEIRDLMMMLP